MLSRAHGMSSDRIVGLQVVLANSSIIVANATQNTEMFWALRGGGHSNFGVVTSFQVRTVDVSQTRFQFRLFTPVQPFDFDGASVPQALFKWQAFAAKPDRRVYTQMSLTNYGGGPPGFNIVFVFNGTSTDADAVFKESGLLEFVEPATS